MRFNGICAVCGGKEFSYEKVLWSELIDSWQLAEYEVDYINRQQGLYCSACGNNLRSMALAAAVIRELSQEGSLKSLCCSATDVRLLEINRAGNLTDTFSKLRNHRLIEHPEFDLQDLQIENQSVDVVVHSDTLEHVSNPVRALSECRRVLRSRGKCIFTVPVVVDRLTRSRSGLTPSYHGREEAQTSDMLVMTEFGMDIWKIVLMAGYESCDIFAYEYPAAVVLIAKT